MADLTDHAVLREIFTYHSPELEQIPKYNALRDAAYVFALAIVANTPKCADQSAAIRLVREACFTANAAVALKGLV
jgi:hypothetical protein